MPMYIRKLPNKSSLIIEKESLPEKTFMFNPSLAYPYLYLRTNIVSDAQDTNVVTLHNMQTKETRTIATVGLQPSVNLYQGLEDLRLVLFNDKLWFTATSTHASDKMISQILIGYFNDTKTEIEKITTLHSSDDIPMKNVVPFVHNNSLKLLDIYTMSIYTVTEAQIDSEVTTTADSEATATAPDSEATATKLDCNVENSGSLKSDKIRSNMLRTSTSPFHLHGNMYGVIAHDVIQTKVNIKLSYIHYYLEFDISSGNITFISEPFWVLHWGVEFVSGVFFDKSSGSVVLYLGYDDKYPYMATTTLSDLRVGKA